MHSRKVVAHMKQRDHRDMVVQFLAERVREGVNRGMFIRMVRFCRPI